MRRAAREMGLSRNTVRKYLEQAEPKRIEKADRRRPVLEEVEGRLEQLMEEWAGRTTAKQRITGTRPPAAEAFSKLKKGSPNLNTAESLS